MNPADQRWAFWPLLPLYPYGRRRTLFSELIPSQLWSLEQLQGVYYVAVPIRLTVVKVPGGLMLVNPLPPTGELRQAIAGLNSSTVRCARLCFPPLPAWNTSCPWVRWHAPSRMRRCGCVLASGVFRLRFPPPGWGSPPVGRGSCSTMASPMATCVSGSRLGRSTLAWVAFRRSVVFIGLLEPCW